VPAGGWLLNSGAATAMGKLIIGVAKAKGIKTINLVRLLPDSIFAPIMIAIRGATFPLATCVHTVRAALRSQPLQVLSTSQRLSGGHYIWKDAMDVRIDAMPLRLTVWL